MDEFIVSARKYRPQHFNTVVGQSHITNTLKNAIINKHLAQAYLFCGPRGVGKTTCARIFAKTINCTNITSHGEACDACESCLSFNSGAALNVYELDAASNNSVEDIRNLVDQVRFAPQLGEYKVYIIDEVHMLSTNAFNAFLKTLEEPPKHAKFILATTEKHKIIPTILSRCQVFNFNRIKTEDITQHLAYLSKEEGVSSELEALQVIAQKADGSLRDACSIFDQMVSFTGNHLSYKSIVENLNVLDYEYYFKITDLLLANKFPEIMLILNDILNKGFDAHHFLIGLAEHLRSLLVCKDPQTLSLLEVSETLKQRYSQQAQSCEILFIMKSLALISKTDVNYKMAKNPRLLVETTLMKLAFLTASQDVEKKKDELIPIPQNDSIPKPAPVKINPHNEVEIKLASKPSVNFEQLKFKASAFSLNELKNPAIKPVLNTVNEAVEELKLPAQELTLEGIKLLIANFAEEKLAQGARQLSTIFRTCDIQLIDERLILTIQNETQKEQLLMVRQEFITQMRSRSQHHALALEIEVAQHEADVKAYKPADVFKVMIDKNPSLLELKKKFDLEIDY